LRQWRVVFLTVVVLGLVGCAPSDSEKGSQEADQPPAETTQTATRESTREPTRERTREATREATGEVTRETASEERTKPPKETSPPPSPQADEDAGVHDATATVTNVVDGDTVDVSPTIDGIARVRLIGVDTPETRECPGGQPLSQEAKAFTTSELQGQEVGLEFDEEKTDQYDRLLAYVYEGGEMFNEDLLEGGYAQVATFPPNTRYLSRFENAQERARAAGLGIWGLSPEEQAQLEDRDNGIVGGGCPQEEAAEPAPRPQSRPQPQPQPAPQRAPAAPKGGDVDCSDFGSSAEAQPYLLPGDPHRLDADNDGQACDRLG
jgi:micrococcal nuclease